MPAFINKYKILQKIGEGSFSEVLKCENRDSKEQYAAKILKKNFQNTTDVFFCAEIIAMQKLGRHPNVLYMHEYFFERPSGKLVFVFELMDMSMYEFMKSKRRCIPEVKVKNYLYQMLKGLDYLHKHGLFHRDIKPENILVRLQQPNALVYSSEAAELVKLADLGSIRGIYSKPPYTEYISTRWYRSPECLLTIGHYGPKMDIWATGCVFYEILTMKPLFPGTNEIDQLAKIHMIVGTPSPRLLAKLKSRSRNLQNFNKLIGSGLATLISHFSEDAQTILKLMLQYDPDIRSNARRLLQHRYFSVLRDEERCKKMQKYQVRRESGDTPSDIAFITAPDKAKLSKFQSSSTKSFHEKAKATLQSKTSVNIPNRPSNSLQSCPTKSSLKMYTSTTTSTCNELAKAAKQRSTKLKSTSNKNVFRNTTSNIIKKTTSVKSTTEKSFHSTSLVMPKRTNNKLPEPKRTKFAL